MKFKKLHLLSVLLIAGLGTAMFSSFSAGITGQSAVGCGGSGCHGASSTNTIVALTGIPGTGWVPNTTYPLTVSVTNTAKVAAGFDMTFSTGTLTAGTGMALTGLELRHTSPKTLTAGTATWTFNWTAPASAATPLTVNLAGNAVNLNTVADANDNWNVIVYSHNAASSTNAPTAVTSGSASVTSSGAMLMGTINANGASTTATFEYGLTTTYGSTINATPNTVTGTSTTSVSATLTGLVPNTLYHYRVKGVNSVATSNGNDLTFTTTSIPPTVTTLPANAVTSTGATVNGLVNANNRSTTVAFLYGTTTGYGSNATATPGTVNGTTTTPASAVLTGLLPATTYHYTITADNGIGIGGPIGVDMTFTTAPAPTPPSATTLAASAITQNSATLNGNVNANGQSTAVTFQYGTTVAYGSTATAAPATVTGNTGTAVNAPVTGLLPATLYHYRVVGTSSLGTSNGADLTFTTPAVTAPIANTLAAGSITATGATINGFIGSGGASTTATFEYGTTVAYGTTVNATPGTVNGTNPVLVNAALNGLLPATLYHYRVVGTNSAGTTNGADFTFTTLSLPLAPSVITLPANAVTGIGAVLRGSVNANNLASTVFFQYGTTVAYGTTVTGVPGTVTGNAATPVSATITGLAATTQYHFRVLAINSVDTSFGADQTFTTDTVSIPAPTIISGPATAVSNTGATMNATANANGSLTTVSVEYGQSLIYGISKPLSPATVSGNANIPVTAVLTGLLANKRYHYRFKAVSAGGTVYTPDATFNTTNLSIGSLAEGGYRLSPNPAGQALMLQTPPGAEPTIAAVSVTGASIALDAKKIAPDQYHVAIGSLSAGNYLLVIRSKEQVLTTRFVKE